MSEDIVREIRGMRYDFEKYMKLVLLELGNIRIQIRDLERKHGDLGHSNNSEATREVKTG